MAEAVPISGLIDPKAFPFLLMDLHRNGATGSLKVEGPSYQKALYYRSGRILFGSSNDPRDQLGAILIEEGKLTPEQLEDVNAKVGPGSPLAKVLAESGYVSQRELGDAARTKVERILSDVVAYATGSFEFEDGVLPKGAVDLKLSTERLVLAAVRRIADRGFVLRHLGGLDVVLAPSDTTDADAEEIRADTAMLLDQLDGRSTLKEAAGRTALDEFEVTKIACALLFLGIVQKAGAASAGAGTAAGKTLSDDELDLAGTARMAFGEPETMIVSPGGGGSAPAAAESDSPFFIPEAESGAAFELPTQTASPMVEPEPEPELEPAKFMPPPEPVAPPPPPPTPPIMAAPPPPPAPPMAASTPTPTRGALPLIPPPSRTPPARSPATIPPPEMPEIPIPPVPSASRPSKEDLAALDALLNSRAIEGPLTPLDKPTPSAAPRWEPKFGQQQPPRRGGRSDRSAAPMIVGITAVVLMLAGGGIGWYYYMGPGATSRPVSAANNTTTPVRPTTLAAAPNTTLPVPATTATPSSPTTTVPAATPTPKASPTPRATPAPKPASSGSGESATLTDARNLMKKGNLSQAARSFASHLKSSSGTYSVQLLVACSDETVQKAAHAVQDQELYIVPVNYKGRDCYRVCWGLYDNEARANSAARSVPEYFISGGAKPKVVPTSSLLP
jgi:hypothetical protein